MAVFSADNKAFSYMGRIDMTDPRAPMLIYAGSNIRFGFRGTSLSIVIDNIPMSDRMWIGYLIDGVQYKAELPKKSGEVRLTLAEGLAESDHTCMIFKRQAAQYYFRFLSVEADDVFSLDPKYDLKIEYFGDSVSAGEVCEAVYHEGLCDPDNHEGQYDNCYFSYTFSAARKLNADFHNNSQGGIALLDHTGYFYGPDIETLTGLESTYDKLSYVPYAPCGVSNWDFTRWTPDIVVFAIGQNDWHPNEENINDVAYMTAWKEKFKEIIRDLRSHYKNARFLVTMTLLKHDFGWEKALDELCAELDDPHVTRFRYRRSGLATDGHPRITEQEEMAIELTDHIRSLIGR